MLSRVRLQEWWRPLPYEPAGSPQGCGEPPRLPCSIRTGRPGPGRVYHSHAPEHQRYHSPLVIDWYRSPVLATSSVWKARPAATLRRIRCQECEPPLRHELAGSPPRRKPRGRRSTPRAFVEILAVRVRLDFEDEHATNSALLDWFAPPPALAAAAHRETLQQTTGLHVQHCCALSSARCRSSRDSCAYSGQPVMLVMTSAVVRPPASKSF